MLVFVADFSCLLYNVYDVNSGAKWGSWSGRDQRRQGRQRIAGSKGWSGILFQIYLQKRAVFMKMIINDVTFFSGRSWRTRFTWRQRGERREGGDSEYWLHLFLRLFLFCVWALRVFFFFYLLLQGFRGFPGRSGNPGLNGEKVQTQWKPD